MFLTKGMFSIGGFWYHAKSRDTAYTMLHGVLFLDGGRPSLQTSVLLLEESAKKKQNKGAGEKHHLRFRSQLLRDTKIIHRPRPEWYPFHPFHQATVSKGGSKPIDYTRYASHIYLSQRHTHKIRDPVPKTQGAQHKGGTTMNKPQNMFHVVFSVGHALKLLWFSGNVVIGWTNKTNPKLSRLNHQYSEIIVVVAGDSRQ